MNKKQIFKGMVAWTMRLSGKKASRQEIESRLAVCLDCPIKEEPEGFWRNSLAALARADFDCGACGCPVNALCAADEPTLRWAKKSEEQLKPRPETCWMNPILDQAPEKSSP